MNDCETALAQTTHLTRAIVFPTALRACAVILLRLISIGGAEIPLRFSNTNPALLIQQLPCQCRRPGQPHNPPLAKIRPRLGLIASNLSPLNLILNNFSTPSLFQFRSMHPKTQ
ncbi:hypothetical protein DSO57_1002622 [Entomophthora muscae]|uniref:Uncharacterized protein n=1 Tax=Entomophthora muscae TaxID=34485 RepID=A0ACC2SY20_9FUNG|nr:hypothetical protein DSO57_1002622 [Entomophthora muscae]